jgi:hypothetical protein
MVLIELLPVVDSNSILSCLLVIISGAELIVFASFDEALLFLPP